MTLPVQKIDLNGTYTVKETAEILQLTDDKVYDLIHTGQLPFVRVVRQFRIGKLRLWAFINGSGGYRGDQGDRGDHQASPSRYRCRTGTAHANRSQESANNT